MKVCGFYVNIEEEEINNREFTDFVEKIFKKCQTEKEIRGTADKIVSIINMQKELSIRDLKK